MRKKILLTIACVIALVFLVSAIFAVLNKPKEVPKQGTYRQTYDVNGVVFTVDTEIINQATAISEISDKIEIDPKTQYLYKDGESNYLLFGLETVVVAVEKNTSFGFTGEIVEEDLQKSDVAGLWFEKNGVKLRYETEDNKYIIQANGGLGITDELYGDYSGKLVVMNDNKTETEYSIFVGVPGTTKWKELDKDIQNAIDTIALSLQLSDVVLETEEESYEVSISGSGISENGISENEISENKVSQLAVSENEIVDNITVEEVEEIGISENTLSDNELKETTSENEVTSVPEEPEVSENEVEVVTVIEKPKEPEPKISENTISENTIKEPQSTQTTAPKKIVASNQKTVKRESNKAYSSDIYTMLHLKDNGIITEYDYDASTLTTPIICVKRIYTGDVAISKIKEYCDSTKDFYYFEAPVGCTWHVAEYAISYYGCVSEPYINIKLKGLNGEPLVYRGVKYSKRCYDIGNCCFYAVPNGCTEYALECGEGNIDNENSQARAAYYKIQW